VQGGNRYRLLLTLQNGAMLTGEEISIFHLPNTDVFLYPNPVRSGQAVTMRTTDGFTKLQIFNTSGSLIKELGSDDRLHAHTTIQLPKGLYFIRTIKEDGTHNTQKLVVY
jgi:hypothetical protein